MFWSGLVFTTSSIDAATAADPGTAKASAIISGFTRRFRGRRVLKAFMVDLLLPKIIGARNAECVRLPCYDIRALRATHHRKRMVLLNAFGSPGEIRETPNMLPARACQKAPTRR